MSCLILNLTVLELPPKSDEAKSMPTERSPSGRDASERSRPAPAKSCKYAYSVSGPETAPIAKAGHLEVPGTSCVLKPRLDIMTASGTRTEGGNARRETRRSWRRVEYTESSTIVRQTSATFVYWLRAAAALSISAPSPGLLSEACANERADRLPVDAVR